MNKNLTNIELLKKILLPAHWRKNIADIDEWHNVEQKLGTALPSDYKNYIDSFGVGKINNFILILTPFIENKYVNLISRGQMDLDAYAESRNQFPKNFTEKIYPEIDGLLPFGVTDNGDTLYWRTVGHPDVWPVTIYEARGPKHFDFSGNMVEFLIQLLQKGMETGVFPDDFASNTPVFLELAT